VRYGDSLPANETPPISLGVKAYAIPSPYQEQSMKISELLDSIEARDLVLPEFQREY
jgi:hypothetical protein